MSSKPTRREFLGTAAAAGWAGAKLYAAGAGAEPGPMEIRGLGWMERVL